MSTVQFATMPLQCNANVGASEGSARWLVQLFPLDLDRGPIPLTSDVTSIGRDAKCDVAFDDASISRVHAVVRNRSGQYVVEDQASTNGVFVNDQLVKSMPLFPGDRIRFGNRIFRFLAADDIEAQYYETVYGMMTRDGLTGVYNKRYLGEVLGREVARCRRYERPLCVAMLDVDHFKQVNDVHGHLVGDEVLCELARRLLEAARADEVVARFGGEEFAIVMVEAEVRLAASVAERCRRVVADRPFHTAAGPLDVTVSIGVAAIEPPRIEDADALLAEADLRLYDAKRNGRNCVVASP